MNEELQKYIAECEKKYGKATSIEILNQWIGEFMAIRNSRPLAQFDGYSPQQMFNIIHGLWGEWSTVKIKKISEDDINSIPLFRQVKYITDILFHEGKIKLTATKAIPPKIVKEVYELGVRDRMIEEGVTRLTKEKNSQTVILTHILLKIMKVIKEQKGVMSLTKNGEKIVKDSQQLFEVLIKSFTTQYNLAYFDGIGNESVGGMANGFSLILIAKYGGQKRSYKFYADKYFKAFPDLLRNYEVNYNTIEKHSAQCYSVRTFERYMLYFGLIEIEKTKYPEQKIYITRTPLFDRVISISLPNI